jgi:hypothetical protein
MAVTARSQDLDGKALDARIANLTTSMNATASALTKHTLALLLDQAQREAVLHYMEHNRINAATVLSTLS